MHNEERRQTEQRQQTETVQPSDARRQLLLRRVERMLARQNTQFIIDHQNDTLEQLSEYLKGCMEQIGRVPARVEVVGGDYIEYRFGSWYKAVRSFYTGKMSEAKDPPAFEDRQIVRALYEAEDARLREQEASHCEGVRD